MADSTIPATQQNQADRSRILAMLEDVDAEIASHTHLFQNDSPRTTKTKTDIIDKLQSITLFSQFQLLELAQASLRKAALSRYTQTLWKNCEIDFG